LGEAAPLQSIMGRLGRYIFLNAAIAFLAVVSTLTLMVWLTQALRRFDMLTSQGQTILVYAGIVGLTLPSFLLVTTPLALFLAVLYTLNRLNGDSELVVMSAAGVSTWQVFRPLCYLAIIVSLVSAAIAAHFGPLSMRTLRDRLAKVNADIVTNVAIPGRFTAIERGLTLHVRDRSAGGTLHGIFIHDARDKVEQTFISERGRIIDGPNGLVLVLEQGSLHRTAAAGGPAVDNSIVEFDRYAFDLSQFTSSPTVAGHGPAERPIWNVIAPAPDDPAFVADPARFRVELHQRLASPFYPFAAFVIAFAFLGAPRTTRQSRWLAIASASLCVGLLQLSAFASIGLLARSELGIPLVYLFPVAAIALGLLSAHGQFEARVPALIQRLADYTVARIERLEAA
jgi:lipopolysaccharide export system permease protein